MTLEIKLLDYEKRQGHEPHWVRQTDVRAAFMAGAAAMAEIIAPSPQYLAQQIARQIRLLLLQAGIEPPLDPATDTRPTYIRALFIELWGLADSLWPHNLP